MYKNCNFLWGGKFKCKKNIEKFKRSNDEIRRQKLRQLLIFEANPPKNEMVNWAHLNKMVDLMIVDNMYYNEAFL